jgi:hypothetical protein
MKSAYAAVVFALATTVASAQLAASRCVAATGQSAVVT